MISKDAPPDYVDFVKQVVASGLAWSVRDQDGVRPVCNASHRLMLPLWPDEETAKYFVRLHWPELQPTELQIREVFAYLSKAAELGILAGIGRLSDPRALVVPAVHLRLDLATSWVRRLARRCR